MYRINFYPEYFERRRHGRARMVQTTVLTLLLGLEAALVIAILLSGVLLGERSRAVKGEVQRLNSQVREKSVARPEVEDALAILNARQARIDWSPKLAAFSERINPGLRLTEVKARGRASGRPAEVQMTGFVRQGGTDMSVSAFVKALQGDSTLADFGQIKLGNLGGGGSDRFQIVCSGRVQ